MPPCHCGSIIFLPVLTGVPGEAEVLQALGECDRHLSALGLISECDREAALDALTNRDSEQPPGQANPVQPGKQTQLCMQQCQLQVIISRMPSENC